MQGYTGIKNDDQLFIAITSDNDLQNELDSLINEGKPRRNSNPQKTLNYYCKLLVKDLNRKLLIAGITADDFFEDIFVYDNKSRTMQINFSSEAYAVNKYKTHVSFLPVLYNYGLVYLSRYLLCGNADQKEPCARKQEFSKTPCSHFRCFYNLLGDVLFEDNRR